MGNLEEGTITIGQRILIESPSKSIEACIKTIVINNASVSEGSAPQALSIMVNELDLASLTGGIVKKDNGNYEVLNILIRSDFKITGSLKPWWKFWG